MSSLPLALDAASPASSPTRYWNRLPPLSWPESSWPPICRTWTPPTPAPVHVDASAARSRYHRCLASTPGNVSTLPPLRNAGGPRAASPLHPRLLTHTFSIQTLTRTLLRDVAATTCLPSSTTLPQLLVDAALASNHIPLESVDSSISSDPIPIAQLVQLITF